MQEQVLKLLGKNKIAEEFLEKLHKDKPRYYRDNLQELLKHNLAYEQEIIDESLLFCIENKQYNAYVLLSTMRAKHYEKQQSNQLANNLPVIERNKGTSLSQKIDTEVEKSDINHYDELFNRKK